MKGFTLVELLVVVAIIGVLAATAIPQFSGYRSRGYDAQMVNDARNAATAQEAHFVDHQEYMAAGDCDQLSAFNGTSPYVTCTLGSDDVLVDFNVTTECDKSNYTQCVYESDPAPGEPNLVCTPRA